MSPHSGAPAPALHAVTTAAAAIVPAACMVATRLQSAAALVASVIAASAANTGHGGNDHVRSVARNKRKR